MSFAILIAGVIYKIYTKRLKKILSIVSIFLSGLLLVGTGSVTSIVIVIITITIYKLYINLKIKINPVGVLFIIHAIFYGIIFLGRKYNDIFLSIFNRDLTLTGRTDIWEVIVELIKIKPIIGYGYGGIWYEGSIIKNYIWNRTFIGMEGAHNGFLEWALQIGILGLIAFIIMILSMGYKLIKLKNKDEFVFRVGIQYIVYILIFYITEKVTSPTSYQILMLFIIIIMVSKEYNKSIREGSKR